MSTPTPTTTAQQSGPSEIEQASADLDRMNNAFQEHMVGLQYGREATEDARYSFVQGWQAKHRSDARQLQAAGGEVENIAEDAYWAIAEHLGTPSGWSVQEHVWEIRELLQESMFAFGRMGANSDLKHPQRDLWERINASLQGIVHEPR